MSRPAVNAAPRLEWMDALRGLAILLVIQLHISPTPDAAQAFDVAVSPLRMAALFLLSGLLLPHALRKPFSTYAAGKLRNIVWPWALWSVLMLPVFGWANARTLAWWAGAQHLWFLATLALLFAVAWVARRVPFPLLALLGFAVGVAADRLTGEVSEPVGQLVNAAWFAGFFFTGAALHPWRARVPLPWWGAALLAGAGVAGMALDPARESGTVEISAGNAVSAVAVIVAAVWAAQRVPAPRVLQWIGRNSIAFYLVHFPLAAVLEIPGVPDIWPQYLAKFATVLALTTLVVLARPWMPWLYAWPRDGLRAPARPGRRRG